MDKNQVRKDIEGLISNIKQHFDDALNHDHIPQLELENIVSKIEKLHQKAIIFHYLNDKNNEVGKTQPIMTIAEPLVDTRIQTDLFGGPMNPKPIVVSPTPKIIEKKAEPIEDIRTGIGINEKFQFINELFEGNANEYTAAINQLNNYASFTEAQLYLNSIKGIYKWDDENPTVEKFIGIVQRKLVG